MAIIVNGNSQPWVANETVTQLLKRMKYIFPLIIVNINGTVIKRADFDKCVIPDNAQVDVIHLLSGG